MFEEARVLVYVVPVDAQHVDEEPLGDAMPTDDVEGVGASFIGEDHIGTVASLSNNRARKPNSLYRQPPKSETRRSESRKKLTCGIATRR